MEASSNPKMAALNGWPVFGIQGSPKREPASHNVSSLGQRFPDGREVFNQNQALVRDLRSSKVSKM